MKNTSMHDLEIQRFSLENLPQPFFDQWLRLTQNLTAFQNPFFSPYFAKAVALASPGNCFVTVLSKSDNAIGFFPFQVVNPNLGRAERIGRHLSDYNGIITAVPLTNQVLKKILAVSKIHQYSFDHLHPYQQSLNLPGEFIREGCAIDFPSGFETYWKDLENENPKIVKDTIRRSQKISREKGILEFEFHSPDSLDLNSLIELKRNQYQSTGKADSLKEDWTRQALRNLHSIDSPHFKATLSKLTVNGQLVSLHLGLFANGILHFWFPIYSHDFSEYSPGRLLFYNLIQNAEKLGIRSIDRGMGTQRHKADFANRTYQLGVGTFRRNTPQCFMLRLQDFQLSLKKPNSKQVNAESPR